MSTIVWDFGDDSYDEDTLEPIHVYTLSGTYTVTLTVTDDDGGVGSDTLTVTVERLPISIDIKLGSDPNSINPLSKGVIPVTILNDGIFDPELVNPETVTFGPDGANLNARAQCWECYPLKG